MKKFLRIIFIIIIVFIWIWTKTGCFVQPGNKSINESVGKSTQKDSNSKEDNFDREIRFYLYDKYHPGTCYGIPQVVDDKIIKARLKGNPEIVKIIRERYKTNRDIQIYEILNSINTFTLKKTLEGYGFSFSDGNCCIVTHYEGILYLVNNKIINTKILKKEIENVPC